MNALAQLARFDRSGFDFVAAAAGKSAREVRDEGVQYDRAKQLVAAARTLCGRTSHSRYQQRAHDGAREHGHRIETLAYIARTANGIKDATKRWRYIDTLCNTPGDLSLIRKRAAELKEELQPRAPRTACARVTHHGDGQATLRVTGPALDVQAAYDAAKNDVAAWLDQDCPRADYLLKLSVNLDLGDYVRIVSGAGDDVQVRFANGVVMSGEEFVRQRLSQFWHIILVGAMDGPVNAYDMRLATPKHREMMLADSATCTWKDCDVPASRCDAHHMTEHQHGGETAVHNLGWLCRYHNYQAGRASRGRTERRGGRIVYVSPSGSVTPTGADHVARAPHRTVTDGPQTGRAGPSPHPSSGG